jgi:diguanylate cyclase (GGDEF)-like protein/PAS domain S-box-containing protein
MDLGVITGVDLLCMTASISLVVIFLAWRSRHLPGVRVFLAVVGLTVSWGMGYSVELLVADLDSKLVFSNLEFIPIALLPVALLAFALDYTGRNRWLAPIRLAPICVIPVVTNILLWVDQGHLMRRTSWLDTIGPYPVVGRTWGPWFWVHAGYSYLLLTVAILILLKAFFSGARPHRKRLFAIILGLLIPIAAATVEAIVPSSSVFDDLTPAVLILAVLLLAWGLLLVRVFNLVPVARHTLVENMRDGLIVVDGAGQVLDLNESARRLIGQPKPQILGRTLATCWESWEQIAAPIASETEHPQLRCEVEGGERHYEVRSSALAPRGQVVAHLLVLSDVTDRVLLEASLRDQALTDGLTGLPNRAIFMSRLGDTIRQSKRNDGSSFAVLVLDLDSFKLVNDSLGHVAGDVLLQSVATKLTRCIRESDTVARMGGDEFILLLHGVSNQQDLLPAIARIRGDLRTPVYFRQQEMTARASMGVVVWDPSYGDAEDVVRAADAAMYQAKENGKDCYRVFDEEMRRAALRSTADETDLRSAIRDNAFSLIYQPVIDFRSGEVHSLEALLRWHHPERGIVFPRDFLTVAENSGLIVALGEICMDEAFSQMNLWQSKHHRAGHLPVRINVSPRQLADPDFVPSVLSRLAAWQVPLDQLILEITEEALVRDPAKARQAMKRLRGLGARLCLDDFGAGQSSLQHLTTFPIQELKVDPRYVSGVEQGSKDLEVVRHITALAHAIGLSVTAEGIERHDQWELLSKAGCELAQGYYIATPMEVDALTGFLEDVGRGGFSVSEPPHQQVGNTPSAAHAPL